MMKNSRELVALTLLAGVETEKLGSRSLVLMPTSASSFLILPVRFYRAGIKVVKVHATSMGEVASRIATLACVANIYIGGLFAIDEFKQPTMGASNNPMVRLARYVLKIKDGIAGALADKALPQPTSVGVVLSVNKLPELFNRWAVVVPRSVSAIFRAKAALSDSPKADANLEVALTPFTLTDERGHILMGHSDSPIQNRGATPREFAARRGLAVPIIAQRLEMAGV